MRTYQEANATAKDQRAFSNGTEGYAWTAQWCDTCIHDKVTRDDTDPSGCPLLAVALLGRTPVEWMEQPWQEVETRPGIVRISPPPLGDTYHCTEYREDPDTRDDGPPDDDPTPPEPEPPPVCGGQVDMFEIFADHLVTEIEQRTAERFVDA